MKNVSFTKTLVIKNSKFLISNRLYQELLSITNLIRDYYKCVSYVNNTLQVCKKEIKQVQNFGKLKTIDIEL